LGTKPAEYCLKPALQTEEKAKRANKIADLKLSPEQQVGGSNPSRRTIQFSCGPQKQTGRFSHSERSWQVRNGTASSAAMEGKGLTQAAAAGGLVERILEAGKQD
jgi:hypothetical protein